MNNVTCAYGISDYQRHLLLNDGKGRYTAGVYMAQLGLGPASMLMSAISPSRHASCTGFSPLVCDIRI